MKFSEEEINNLIQIILKNEFTMVSRKRLLNLKRWCIKLNRSRASFVECGVAKGGCLALMVHLSDNNKVFGFDSFEGNPDLTKEDEEDGRPYVGYRCSGVEGIKAVYKTFSTLNLPVEKVTLVKGYFEDTLVKNKNKIGKIAVLRLDSDWYKSTKYCLDILYNQVIPGGVIIIDDYGTFVGCRKAVHDFMSERSISSELQQTDCTEYFWIKG